MPQNTLGASRALSFPLANSTRRIGVKKPVIWAVAVVLPWAVIFGMVRLLIG